jgi:hypothetical protein
MAVSRKRKKGKLSRRRAEIFDRHFSHIREIAKYAGRNLCSSREATSATAAACTENFSRSFSTGIVLLCRQRHLNGQSVLLHGNSTIFAFPLTVGLH